MNEWVISFFLNRDYNWLFCPIILKFYSLSPFWLCLPFPFPCNQCICLRLVAALSQEGGKGRTMILVMDCATKMRLELWRGQSALLALRVR